MADDQTDSGLPQPHAEKPNSESTDAFDGLVLDDDFVRGGAYEPPARTRAAIARYGDQQTSWRHGGGLRRHASTSPAQPARRTARKSSKPGKPGQFDKPGSRSTNSTAPSRAMARLPLIISVVVVIIAALLVFR